MTYEIVPDEDIVARECVHASYSRTTRGKMKDCVIVKEILHTKDGRKVPSIRFIEDYPRVFGVTKELFQDHNDKKSYEELAKLTLYKCAQHELHDRVGRALGRPGAKGSLRQLARNQFLYGVDIKTPVLVKRGYRDKYKVDPTPATLAVYDIETNMNSPEEEIIMASMTMKKRVRTRVNLAWVPVEMRDTFIADVKKRARELIGDVMDKRGITEDDLDIQFAQSPAACVVECFEAAHIWQPDYVAIFNMKFDIPKSLEALKENNIHPNAVFCDPRVPFHYRNFRWNEGPSEKVKKNDGDDDVVPLHPADQWHTCDTQASFIIADPMLLYKRIRTASANDPEYNLDYLLNKHGCKGKLKFVEADGMVGRLWHEFMQANYPIEYTVYNIYDCLGTEALDEATGDIAYSLPALLKCSEYYNYDSQPTMVADDYHFFLLKEKKMLGSTSDKMLTDVDKFSPGLRGWISTLHAYLGPDPDTDLVADMDGHGIHLYLCTSDADVVSTYPKLQDMLNIDRATTMTELSSVHGFERDRYRHCGIDLSGGFNNATMICQTLFGLPDLETVRMSWIADMEEAAGPEEITFDFDQLKLDQEAETKE